MEENCNTIENGTRKLALTIPNLDTSLSIRRSLTAGGGEDSSRRLHGKGGSPSAPTCDRVLSRSKILESGTPCRRYYTGTVLLTLLGVMVVSVSVFSGWNIVSLDCPLVPTSRDSIRGPRSFEGEEIKRFEANQNLDSEENEFVDDKCWSSSRHLFFRPEDRRLQPSPALRRALSQYEGLHARCTVGKTWKSVADLLLQKAEGSEGECKYMIYFEGWEGLGNRLLSLVSAFAFALATNRTLLIDSRGHLRDLLCEPFSTSSWTLPEDFPYDEVGKFPSLENYEEFPFPNEDEVGKVRRLENVENYAETELGINLNLRHEQTERDRKFFCPETQERLGSVRWLVWNSNQYYIPRLFMIPSFWTRLHPLFPHPDHAFSQLVRYLCLPVNSVWAKTERIYQTYLSSSQKLVGLQIRHHSELKFSPMVYERVMKCLLGTGILPNVSRLESIAPPLPAPLDLTALDGKRRDRRTSVFVASLSREYYEALRDFYLDQGTSDGSLVSVHTVAYEGAEKYSFDSVVRAYIDIWLLSFSDILVTSAWSTFGYLAQGYGGLRPYMMNFNAPSSSAPFCVLGQSMEPCNHYPFLLSIYDTVANVSKEHATWINRHIRQCQDEEGGRQIVSM